MDLLIPTTIVSGLGLVFGIGLAYTSKKFEVKVDEKIALVRAVVPGANCGACGESGCDGFSEGVVAGRCKIDGCPVGGAAVAALIAEIMGVEIDTTEEKTARVNCGGSFTNCKTKYNYAGITDCASAANLHNGPMSCQFGCVGMGNCVRSCQFGAIEVIDGLAKVNESKCTTCGKCVEACPKKIIEIVPRKNEYTVACSSYDRGNIVRKNCAVGCIGCMKCVKACQYDAIAVNNNLSKIDYKKCVNCGECIKVCPTNSISLFRCSY